MTLTDGSQIQTIPKFSSLFDDSMLRENRESSLELAASCDLGAFIKCYSVPNMIIWLQTALEDWMGWCKRSQVGSSSRWSQIWEKYRQSKTISAQLQKNSTNHCFQCEGAYQASAWQIVLWPAFPFPHSFCFAKLIRVHSHSQRTKSIPLFGHFFLQMLTTHQGPAIKISKTSNQKPSLDYHN